MNSIFDMVLASLDSFERSRRTHAATDKTEKCKRIAICLDENVTKLIQKKKSCKILGAKERTSRPGNDGLVSFSDEKVSQWAGASKGMHRARKSIVSKTCHKKLGRFNLFTSPIVQIRNRRERRDRKGDNTIMKTLILSATIGRTRQG